MSQNESSQQSVGMTASSYRFDPAPPPAELCWQALYGAFAGYGIASDLCRQCFPPEAEAEMRRYGDTRTAPYAAFSAVFFENRDCAGGVETLKHWLPRVLELGLIDSSNSFFGPTIQRTIAAGLLIWPEQEQEVLRQLFSRAIVNWFDHDDPTLGVYVWGDKGTPQSFVDDHPGLVSGELGTGLVFLQIDPASFFNWLFQPQRLGRSDRVWEFCWDVIGEGIFAWPEMSLHLPEGEDPEAYRAALDGLALRARLALAGMLRQRDLLAEWEAAERRNSPVARKIAEIEQMLREPSS